MGNNDVFEDLFELADDIQAMIRPKTILQQAYGFYITIGAIKDRLESKKAVKMIMRRENQRKENNDFDI